MPCPVYFKPPRADSLLSIDAPLILRRTWRAVCYYSGDPKCKGETSPRRNQYGQHRFCDSCRARIKNGPKGTRPAVKAGVCYDGETHLKTRYMCLGCQIEPVKRNRRFCDVCRNQLRTPNAPTLDTNEFLDRKRNWSTTFRSAEEKNHDDHIRRRNLDRYRSQGRPGFRPIDFDRLPDSCRRFANHDDDGVDQEPVDRRLLNKFRINKRLPPIYPISNAPTTSDEENVHA